MRHQFTFDKKTGTMVPASGSVMSEDQDVTSVQPSVKIQRPEFKEAKEIAVKAKDESIAEPQFIRMQRVAKITPVQLVNEDGNPEAYLDSLSTGLMIFRELEDYDLCQITDEKTGKVLAYIGGYALQIKFDMSELRTMERIEQCLQGIVKLFRHKIMTHTLGAYPKE